MPKSTLQETYSQMMADTWRVFFIKIVCYFFVINLFFATVYYLIPNSINNGPEVLQFFDAFNFSIQTFSTIGYGGLLPNGILGNLLVCIESFTGIIFVALITGMLYSRFSKPIASFAFSNKMILHTKDEQDVLQFRVVNTRGHQLLDVQAQLHAVFFSTNSNGKTEGKLHTLRLERAQVPALMLNWVFTHVIDETSPLWGAYDGTSLSRGSSFHATIIALDKAVSQSVYSNQIYERSNIMCNHRFADMIAREGNVAYIHVNKVHETLPKQDP